MNEDIFFSSSSLLFRIETMAENENDIVQRKVSWRVRGCESDGKKVDQAKTKNPR